MILNSPILLHKLQVGQSGLLKCQVKSQPSLEQQRLEELGFVDGAQVKLLRKGPMGSPLLFEISGTKIGIRREEAAWFEVI
ncbi:MAG: FeoA family protein [Myxococcota bacterium]